MVCGHPACFEQGKCVIDIPHQPLAAQAGTPASNRSRGSNVMGMWRRFACADPGLLAQPPVTPSDGTAPPQGKVSPAPAHTLTRHHVRRGCGGAYLQVPGTWRKGLSSFLQVPNNGASEGQDLIKSKLVCVLPVPIFGVRPSFRFCPSPPSPALPLSPGPALSHLLLPASCHLICAQIFIERGHAFVLSGSRRGDRPDVLWGDRFFYDSM